MSDNTIRHKNIIYVRDINAIGGVETYAYELVKKYKDLDIAVVCKRIAPEQRKRITKFCKVYIHKDQKIDCKVAIINWDTSIIDYITKDIWKENARDDEGIYQGIHADYTHPSQGTLPQDKRIKAYLAITEDILNNFSELSKEKNVMLCRNPYQLEETEKPLLILVSPTRLTKEKGGELMLKLANALDDLGIKFLWLILTTQSYLNESIFSNPSVVWVKNRLDIDNFLRIAHWVVLPSECEGDSYTIKEALYRGVPIVARHLNYFDEYGIEDGKNALFINNNNVLEIAKRIQKPLKFKFEPIQDGYDKLLYKSKSHYKEDKNMKVKIRCIQEYQDIELSNEKGSKVFVTPNANDENYERIVTRERADFLVDLGVVEIVEIIKEENKIAKAVRPRKKEEKAIKKNK